MLMTVAPSSMAIEHTSAVNSRSARVASIGENSTSSTSDFACARQPGDDRALHLTGDRLDRLEVARARDREARLDHVDAQPGQLLRDLELLLGVQRDARRLLAVAQRRVKDLYSVHRFLSAQCALSP